MKGVQFSIMVAPLDIFTIAISRVRDADATWQALEDLAQAIVGCRLFTVMTLDLEAGLARRAFTSHPMDYPASGTKPIHRDRWFDVVHGQKRSFTANTIEDIAKVFPDHELIASLGCGSVLNLPAGANLKLDRSLGQGQYDQAAIHESCLMIFHSSSGAYTHAGGVVYRSRYGTAKFLLVTARRKPGEWVLPKGHIEVGEQPDQAAVREVEEESGVRAHVVKPLGDLEMTVEGQFQRIAVFLMLAAGEGDDREGRNYGWFRIEDALSRVTFAESRELIARGAALLKAESA